MSVLRYSRVDVRRKEVSSRACLARNRFLQNPRGICRMGSGNCNYSQKSTSSPQYEYRVCAVLHETNGSKGGGGNLSGAYSSKQRKWIRSPWGSRCENVSTRQRIRTSAFLRIAQFNVYGLNICLRRLRSGMQLKQNQNRIGR